MKPLHAARLAFCCFTLCLPAALAQVVVKLEQPAGQRTGPRSVLRIGAAVANRQAGAKEFPGAGPAIDLGLAWLLAHQDDDGRWDADGFMKHDAGKPTDGPGGAGHDVGLTGLAVLALAREGPAPDGPRRRAIERAASWLGDQQEENGLIGGRAMQGFVYGHAIAALALCATTAATGDDAARKAAQRALDYLEHHRSPFGVWRYQPREASGDSSITTWATLALLAGKELGLKFDPQAFKNVETFFQSVTDKDGRVGYTRAGEGSSRMVGTQARFPANAGETLTAAGMMCGQALGHSATKPEFLQAKDLLLGKPAEWTPDEGRVDYCYWFFATEAMLTADGPARTQWGTRLVDALVKGQRVDAAFAGSWDAIDPWGQEGGRIYATAMSVLALQALYGSTAPTAANPAAKPGAK